MTTIFSGMHLYLDDARKAPFGWELVRTARECLQILKTGKVAALSLDHDLAEEHYRTDWSRTDKAEEMTGYDVAVWLEEQAAEGRWELVPKSIGCHSMNPIGKQRIVQCIQSIQRLAKKDGRPEVELLPAVYHEAEDEAAWQKVGRD